MKVNKSIFFILAIVLVFPINSLAKSKTNDKIQFRQSGMNFMRWNMIIIKNNVIDNPSSFDQSKVKAAVSVIDAISNSGIESLYTPDTRSGTGWEKTKVKPELFEKKDELNKYAVKLIKESQELVKVSNSSNISAIRKQFKNVRRVCKGCHKKFRKK